MYDHCRASMFWVVLFSFAVTVMGEGVDNDWIDPYDMINYDSSTKTMRNPIEPASYLNVPTKRRAHSPDSSQPTETHCVGKLMELQKQIKEQNKEIKALSQRPTCTPVFKRFLRRLLNEIQRVGMPTDSAVGLYDAKIKLSRQSMNEIQMLLESEESCRTGALDNVISQILVDFKQHDYEAWKWRFENTFNIELDTVLKLGLGILLIMAIITTQLWSRVAWCVQLRRLFAVSFTISIIWNWFYMYKIAFADHQKNMVKLEGISEKCTGLKKYDWYDNLKELYRSTLTLEDDPCKKYYELVFVDPLLLVPPTKAISVTFVTFITEPLQHIGKGISEFIQALLKDLPVTWQIIVFSTLVLFILAFMYLSVHGAFRYGILAPFRHPQIDPPPPQPQYHLQGMEDHDQLPQRILPHAPGHLAASVSRNQIQRRRIAKPQQMATKVVVETLRTAERHHGDETDVQLCDTEQSLLNEFDVEEPMQSPTEVTGASANANTVWTEDSTTNTNLPQSQNKQAMEKKKHFQEEASKLTRPKPPAEKQPSQTAIKEPTNADQEELSLGETVRGPVHETSSSTAE